MAKPSYSGYCQAEQLKALEGQTPKTHEGPAIALDGGPFIKQPMGVARAPAAN
ncbi:MAG: hypothetical protein ACRYFV_02835 [Janthinobacterium lividum]